MSDEPKIYTISHSDQEQHSRCEWAHHYGYGYNLVPKITPEHLQIGTSFHKIAAGYYEGLRDGYNHEDAIEAGRDIWKEQLQSGEYEITVLSTTGRLFEQYVKYYNPKEWEILWVEEYIEYLVNDQIMMNGEIDLVVLNKRAGKFYGQLGVIDHKTCYNFMTKAEIGTHSQIPKYMFALNQMKIFDQKIEFGVLNQVRWREVKDIDKLFARIVLDPSEVKQANFINEHIKQGNRIIPKRNLPRPELWKNESNRTTIKDICKYCDFQGPCVEELDGKSSELTLKVYFTQKDLSYRENRTRVNGKPREN